jgi:hypothetical protein
MTSVGVRTRQVSTDVGYYIPLGNLIGKIYSYNATAGGTTFAAASWPTTKWGSTISTSGGNLLKDMGKTVVSASRTFRKVQLVVSSFSTFGVAGAAATAPAEDYLTGYIELGFDSQGTGNYTPVAHYGR